MVRTGRGLLTSGSRFSTTLVMTSCLLRNCARLFPNGIGKEWRCRRNRTQQQKPLTQPPLFVKVLVKYKDCMLKTTRNKGHLMVAAQGLEPRT